MKRANNTKKFPAANHQPNHLASYRKSEAAERQAAYDQLTVQEKIDRLDQKFGVGQGGAKQRARLNALLAKSNVQK